MALMAETVGYARTIPIPTVGNVFPNPSSHPSYPNLMQHNFLFDFVIDCSLKSSSNLRSRLSRPNKSSRASLYRCSPMTASYTEVAGGNFEILALLAKVCSAPVVDLDQWA